jgi:ParB family transcriptional regulator, chromosome partitioning protein
MPATAKAPVQKSVGAKVAPVGKLQEIPISDISPNPRNPRQTFNPIRLERLAASIEDIGLQVPITVSSNPEKGGSKYILLDGERRFRAAVLINQPAIQALVVTPPSASENAVRMFNIHMLRDDWVEIETAWALEQIMQETRVTADKDLRQLTGLSIDRIRNMKRVLAFPRQYQEMVAEGKLPYNLLVELDKNILSRQRDSRKASTDDQIISLTVSQLRDVFLKKYMDDVESDVVDLRRVGTLFDTAKRGQGKVAERAKQALQRLVFEPKATIEEAYEVGAASSVELRRVVRDMCGLPSRIDDLLSGTIDEDQRQEVGEALDRLIGELEQIRAGFSH